MPWKGRARMLYNDITGKTATHERQQRRPLFVAEATSWKRSVLLVVTCAEVVVLGTSNRRTPGASYSEADVLLLIPAELLLPPRSVSPGMIQLNYYSKSLRVQPSLFCLAQPTILAVPAADAGLSSQPSDNVSSSSSDTSVSQTTTGTTSNGPPSTTATSGCSGQATSSCENLVLSFADEDTATSAAAAVVYAAAAHRAAAAWLYGGAPPALTMGIAGITASYQSSEQPAALGSNSSCSSGECRYQALARGAGPAEAVQCTGRTQHVMGPCAWGVAVEVPESWAQLLAGPGLNAHPQLSPLAPGSVRVPQLLPLPPGQPQALEVTLSTPLGVAAARIAPEHIRAAATAPEQNLVLAGPANTCCSMENGHSSCSSDTGASADSSGVQNPCFPRVAFGAEVCGQLLPSRRSRNSSSNCINEGFFGLGSTAALATPPPQAPVMLKFQQSVFAAVRITVKRADKLPGNSQVLRVPPAACGNLSSPQQATRSATGAAPRSTAVQPTTAPGSTAAQLTSRGWDGPVQPGLRQLVLLVQVAVLVGVLLVLLVRQPLPTLQALLPTAAAVGLLLLGPLQVTPRQAAPHGSPPAAAITTSSSSSSGSASSKTVIAGQSVMDSEPAATAQEGSHPLEQQQQQAQGAGQGWVVVLEGAVLLQEPGEYLQAQISRAQAQLEAAESASTPSETDAEDGVGAAADAASVRAKQEQQQGQAGASAVSALVKRPWLVSDPDPSWVTPDIFDRFLIGKGTLAAARKQAAIAHAWRQRRAVDTVLTRPCRSFDFMRKHLANYLLAADSKRGSVEIAFVSRLKDLADAMRAQPEFGPDSLDEYLAFYNEYMYKVALPEPLPGGTQTLIIDCVGAHISYMTSDTIRLFRVLSTMELYYPERLKKAVVINVPSWFAYAWRVASSMLDEVTRSKVVVVSEPQQVYAALEAALGPDDVPAAYGGPCTTPLNQYPAGRAVDSFHAALVAASHCQAEA